MNNNHGLSFVDRLRKDRKMTQATYAVVIVTYNREQLLRECIRHVNAQSISATRVIIVDNASTDGTAAYLKELSKEQDTCQVIECPENLGGAGGFATGIAHALNYEIDYVLIIDDDAILSDDYMEKLLLALKKKPEYHAFAGSVITDGKIDIWHRRMLSRVGLLFRNCPVSMYQSSSFTCDIVSFCGMLVDTAVIKKIGLPDADYFIWNDDAEYSLRILKYSKFLIIPDAILDHRTAASGSRSRPRRYEWRDYYAVRNRLLLVKKHGSIPDKIVNYANLFIHVIFRNRLFQVLQKDHYDWAYENRLVRQAIHDAATLKHRTDNTTG